MKSTAVQTTRRPASGGRAAFTLIAMMIVLAIMAVVMSISIPTFYRSVKKDAIRQATQQVLDACKEARTQAILNGRPCDLVIRPADRTLVPHLARDPVSTNEEQQTEQAAPADVNAAVSPDGQGDTTTAGTLPDGIAIMFIGVNFVADLQTAESVPVRFYPNGTADEFAMLLRSDANEWRKFTMDVTTGLVNWEVVR
jgi:type II secretory pathway pseudopilin PulG